MLNEFNKLKVYTEGHAARYKWPKPAHALHAWTAARDAARGWRENLICG